MVVRIVPLQLDVDDMIEVVTSIEGLADEALANWPTRAGSYGKLLRFAIVL